LKSPFINSNPHLHKEKEMVDFRKAFLLLAVLVLVAGIASAQYSPLTCTANAGNPPQMRAEGLAEPIGDVQIFCYGGTPTAVGLAIPKVNIQVSLTTNITSRLYSDNGTEAMLLIDDPAPANQRMCAAPGNCTIYAASSIGVGNYTGVSGRPNVYQSVKVNDATVAWLGVPVDPPGTNPYRLLRLVNIRANATIAGTASTLIPTNVNMFIAITGNLPITSPYLTVGYIQSSLDFSVSKVWTYNACEKPITTGDAQNNQFYLRFTEKFPSAFRDNSQTLHGVQNQSLPSGLGYYTESRFTNASSMAYETGSTTGFGLATQGTRFYARFTSVPANVTVKVKRTSTSPSSGYANIVTGYDSNGADGTVQDSPADTGTDVTVVSSGGSGSAVWEVINHDISALETFSFLVTVSFDPDTALPDSGDALVSGWYAPLSTVATMSTSARRPRFYDNATPKTAFSIIPCQTNLLFPWVANQGAYDTGIAISNTSLDIFSTPTQTGTCTLYYFGNINGNPVPSPNSWTTSSKVKAGDTLLYTLSNGSSNYPGASSADKGFAGFAGYIIAKCNFQYAHGYAFISNLGEPIKWAQSYLALVLDQDKYNQSNPTRTKAKSEVLGN
jgi:hypothetical protein